jgi:coenzyme F420-reducing hydrogenase beta subunit
VPTVYAVKHKRAEVLAESASGGLFTAISDYVLENNGYVVGAAFDELFSVQHIIINTTKGRNLLRGSKYVQSRKGDVFSEIKKLVNKGNLVYFTGLPCEVAGLNSFLRKRYDNLITSDLVCHGAASPKIFSDYLNYIRNQYMDDTIVSVNFRSKGKGWNNLHIAIGMLHNQYLADYYGDSFGRLFFMNIILRPSCHDCKFTNCKRPSDITLADFWGIEKSHPKFFDNRGVSMALINTVKGQQVFEHIKSNIDWIESNTNKCMQPQLHKSSKPSAQREEFWNDYYRHGYSYLQKKYIGSSLKNRIKSQILYPVLNRMGILKFIRKKQ